MQDLKETTAYRQSLKSRIMETAMRAFAQRGIRAVRMDDVASMLGISKRTLYEIYADKEELLYQGVKAFDQQRKEALNLYMQQGHTVMDIIMEVYRQKIVEVHSVCQQFYVELQKYPKVGKYLAEEHERNRERFIQFLHRGVEEGYFRPDVNYDLVAHLFDAVGEHVMARQLVEQYSMKELFACMLFVPLRGFCTNKGLAVVNKMTVLGLDGEEENT